MSIIIISGNEKPRAEMNTIAKNNLLNILVSKGIQIPELEEEIESAYERYCDRIDEIEKKDKEEEYQRKKQVWDHSQRLRQWHRLRTGE